MTDVVNSPDLFLEEWDPQKIAAITTAYGSDFEWTRRRCELGAAAPAMVRVLVELEFPSENDDDCLMCDRIRAPELGALKMGHEPGCPLDAALTAAGLPDQASRDKLRELLESK
jgi:hypothetical protein